MNVIWSIASTGHLQQLDGYLHEESPGGSTVMRRRILQTVRRVSQMPLSGRVGRIDGTREAVVPRSPFIVVYELAPQTVYILGVWHAARLWPESF
jgi:toxin ParE1/3/4